MALSFPYYFGLDLRGKDTNLFPVVVIGNYPGDTYTPANWFSWLENSHFISTNQYTYRENHLASYNKPAISALPILLNIPSLKESVDIEHRKYKINSINLEISNYKYNNQRFSEIIDSTGSATSLINTECRIFWISPKVQSIIPYDINPGWLEEEVDSAFEAYFGIIRKYTHDDEKVRLVVEDRSQAKLHRDLPSKNVGMNVPDKYKNKFVPMVFGEVDKSPLVTANYYASFKCDYNETVSLELSTNEYGIGESPLYLGDENGTVNVIENPTDDHLWTSAEGQQVTTQIDINGNEISLNKNIPLAAQDKYNLTVLDRSPNFQLSLMNDKEFPTSTTSDFCSLEQLNGVKWYTGAVSDNVANYVQMSADLPNYHTGEIFNVGFCSLNYGAFGAPVEHLLLTLRINFEPVIEYENLMIRSFVLNGHNLTASNGNKFGNVAVADEVDVKAMVQGWQFNFVDTIIGSAYLLNSPLGPGSSGCTGISMKYFRFFNIQYIVDPLHPHNPDVLKINSIFNFENAVPATYDDGELMLAGSNPSADLTFSSSPSFDGNSGFLAQDHIVFQFKQEGSGIMDIDFKNTTSVNATGVEDVTGNYFGLGGNLNNIGILRIYDAYNVFKYNFYGRVKGRRYTNDMGGAWFDGTVAREIQQIYATLLYDELNLPEQSNKFAGYGDWLYDFTIHEKINSKKLIENLASASPFIPRFDSNGKFRLNEISATGGTLSSLGGNEIIKEDSVIDFSYSRTPIEDVYSKIELKYYWDYAVEDFTKEVTPPITVNTLFGNNYKMDYYGLKPDHTESTLTVDDMRGKFIRDDVTADLLAKWLLLWHSNQHLKISVKLPLSVSLNIEIGDIVQFDKVLGDVRPYGIKYDENRTINGQIFFNKFMVLSTQKNLDFCQIEVIQMHSLVLCIDESGNVLEADCTGICGGAYLGEGLGDTTAEHPAGYGWDICGVCGGNSTPDMCPCENGACDHPSTGGTCTKFLDCAGVCDGTAELNECGVCNEEPVYGCMDTLALNYNANACVEDSTCLYPLNIVGVHECCGDYDDANSCPIMLTDLGFDANSDWFLTHPGLILDLEGMLAAGNGWEWAVAETYEVARYHFNNAGGLDNYTEAGGDGSSRPIIYHGGNGACEGSIWIEDNVQHYLEINIMGHSFNNLLPAPNINGNFTEDLYVGVNENMNPQGGLSDGGTSTFSMFFTKCTQLCDYDYECCGTLSPYGLDSSGLVWTLVISDPSNPGAWFDWYHTEVPAGTNVTTITTGEVDTTILEQLTQDEWNNLTPHRFKISSWLSPIGSDPFIVPNDLSDQVQFGAVQERDFWIVPSGGCNMLGDCDNNGVLDFSTTGLTSEFIQFHIVWGDTETYPVPQLCNCDFDCDGLITGIDNYYLTECMIGMFDGTFANCQEWAEAMAEADPDFYDIFSCWLNG